MRIQASSRSLVTLDVGTPTISPGDDIPSDHYKVRLPSGDMQYDLNNEGLTQNTTSVFYDRCSHLVGFQPQTSA